MSFRRSIRATRTRAFATTMHDPSSMDGEDMVRFDPSELPDIGDIVGLHYRLADLLGEGNFGKVYTAERVDVPEHRVALKILPRALYSGRNVERELIMLATVGHPNVVQLKDHGMSERYVWFTMPIYEGETLEKRLERGSLTLREAYDIFLPVARAVEALHRAGLRHQDIKPDNIYLARFGETVHPVLLDLGVAAEKDSTFVAGTALFAAPEQLLAITGTVGAVPLTEKMDTYCVAATLLFALGGEKRFPGARAKHRDDIAQAHEVRARAPLTGILPDLEGKPRELLEDQLSKWMALDPEARPSIRELAENLDVLLEQEREAERNEVRALEAERKSLFRARVGAFVGLIAVVGLSGVGLWKRETIRLASELEQARAIGEASFDKLDTCTASFSVERRDKQACEDLRDKERVEHEKLISDLGKAEDCEAMMSKLQTGQTTLRQNLKTCEDDARAKVSLFDTEKKKMRTEWETERAGIEAQKAQCEDLIDVQGAELDALRGLSDSCDKQKASCISERDACEKKVSGGQAPPAPTSPPTPPAPSAPPTPPQGS